MKLSVQFSAALAVVAFVPFAAHAAVSVDTSASAAQTAAATTCSIPLTVGNNSDRAVLVGVSYLDQYLSPKPTVSSVTFQGVSFSRVGTTVVNSHLSQELWQAVGVPAGAGTVLVTLSASVPSGCGALSLSGVDQTTPTSGIVTANALGTISTAITSAAGNLTASFASCDSCASITSNQTGQWNTTVPAVTGVSSVGKNAASTAPGAASVTHTWNDDWGGSQMAAIGVNVNASASAPPPADTTAPTVSVTNPIAGTTVSGTTVSVSANASDNVGVVGVQFKLDGVNLGAEDLTAPYSVTWDTTTATNGSHTLSASARDAAGNTGVSTGVSITVSNGTTTDTTAPSTPTGLLAAVVSATQVNLTWSASTDNVGVTGYRVFRNGALIGAPTGTSWSDTTVSPSTTYSYTVSALDAAGNTSAQSTAVSATTPAAAPATSGPYPQITVVPPTPWPVWSSAIPTTPPCSTAGCTTYYVDGTNGNDANSGLSATTAFKTIARAIKTAAGAYRLQPGDTVLIRKGLYREGIAINGEFQGAAGKPITFGSYGDGEVVLDGSTKISGWTNIGGSVWKAPVAFTPVGVVVNNVPLKQVREAPYTTAPAQTAAAVTSGSGKWYVGGGYITADMGSVGVSDPNTADIVVPNNVGDQQHVFFGGVSYFVLNGLTIRGSGAAGIWTYPLTSTLNASHITVQNSVIEFNGKGGIIFSSGTDNKALYNNIHDNVLINWPRGNGQNAESGGGWPGTLGWYNESYGLAEGNLVYHNGGEGIITYGWTPAATSGHMTFQKNIAYDNWSMNSYIDNQPYDTVTNNIFYNHAPDPSEFIYIGTGYPWSDVVEKYRTCLSISDEAGSSSDGKSHNDHTTVTNNLIAGCRVGIYDLVDGGTAIPTHGLKYATIKNNTIIMDPYAYTTYEAGILLQDNGTQNVGSVISNNIMYGNGNGNGDYNANGVQTPLIFSQSAGTQPGITFSNNDYYSTWANPFVIGTTPKSWTQWKTAETETGSVLANPLFSDVSQFGTFTSGGFDYHGSLLQSASPAIALNAGWSQTGGTTPPPPAGDTTAPSVPTGLTATAVSTSQINLSWTASTDNVGVVGYLLFRGGVQIATASTTSYADTGLSAGTTYSYTVVALDAAGNRSPQSIAATATTQALADTTPPVLSNITATNLTSSSATITWTTNEPADDQVAYGVTTTYDTTTAVGTTLSTSHSVLLSNLSAGTTYHYQVRSKDAAGNSAASIDLTFATQALADTTPPAAITTLASSGYTPTSAVLSWVAPGDNGSTGTAASYDIRYSTAPITAANFSSATTVTGEPPPLAAGTSQSYTLVALASATTYYVAMTATDAAGNVSAISNVVSFSTPSTDVTPPTLSAIMATPSTTSSIISWTTNEPATSRVNYGKRKSSLTSSVSDSLLLTNHSLTLSPLTSGTTYYYRVVSKDAAGNTSTSSVRSFTTRAGAANALGALLGMLGSAKETVSHTGSDTAAAIGAFTGQAVDRQVFFSWKNPSENDFVRARLVRSDVATPSSATDGTIAYEGTGQSFVDTNLVNGRTYYYAIFPIRLTGADAAPSATLTIAPKAGVTQITLAQAAAPAVTATDTVSATSFRFTRNLKLGSSGADVRELQKFLNAMGFVIAASGPGSPGRESTYFGPSTMRALVKYQKSKGITPAAGFFGAGTRASIK